MRSDLSQKAPSRIAAAAGFAALLLAEGCTTAPMGPMVAVMPAPNKPFPVFQEDQVVCKQFAQQEVAGGAEQAQREQFGTAALATILGAGLGGAIGGGEGAGIGAAAGALGGTTVSAGPAQSSEVSLQRRYDLAYSQCMYAKGNQVPGFATPSPPPPPPPSRMPQTH